MPSRRAQRAALPKEEAPTEIAWILAGRALWGGRLQPLEVGIDPQGWIRRIAKSLSGAPRRDVGDSILLPSATDLHVHFRDPGVPDEVESISSGTIQSALGGVGLVGEMPNTSPPVTDVKRLEEKAARVRGRAAVDVFLYAAASAPDRLRALGRKAAAFKIFLSPTTGFDQVPDSAELEQILAALDPIGLPVAVHAEDPAGFHPEIVPASPSDWNRSRPPEAELAAIERLAESPPGLRLHVAHVTTARAVERLRAQGRSFEVTPHHLLLSQGSFPDARGKVNPPLRSESDRRGLWEAFARGEIPCLASDHAPHSVSDTELPFPRAPSGVPNAETMLPLLFARVRAKQLPLERLVAAACERPARWMGQPRGRLAVGHRADLLVVDFRARRKLSARSLHAPCGWTPFEGWEAIFPAEHYRAGERIVEAGEYVGRPTGELVRPEFAR